MNTQLSSRLFLLGLSFNASLLLATVVSPAAFAQSQGAYFTSTASEGFGESFSSAGRDQFETSGGDYFSSRGDSFSSSSDTFSSTGTEGAGAFFHGDQFSENSAFEENEQIDPSAFTWSTDPRDVFASSPSDTLAEFPLYTGRTKSFSFISVSDGPQIKTEAKKSFEPPRAFKAPKWSYWREGSMPSALGPISGSEYRDSFGHTTDLYGWPVNRQPVRVYFAGDVGDVRNGLVKRVFVECMRQWCGATKGLLKFTVTEDSRSADIILCRDFPANYELAENNPTFHNGWLDRVKIKLIDSTCDKVGEAQLRAVLLHSAGHALGYFKHTGDKNSAMNENCSHVSNPTQTICPCDVRYIKDMYSSYKTCYDQRFKKEVDVVKRVPWGQPIPLMPTAAMIPIRSSPICPHKIARPTIPTSSNAHRQRLTIKPPTIKRTKST